MAADHPGGYAGKSLGGPANALSMHVLSSDRVWGRSELWRWNLL